MNKDYIEFKFEVDNPHTNLNNLGILKIINDNVFSSVEFIDNKVILYIKNDAIIDSNTIEKVAEKKILSIFIEFIKTTESFNELSITLQTYQIKEKKYSSVTENVGLTESVIVQRFDENGNEINQEDFEKQQIENRRKQYGKAVNDAESNNMILTDINYFKFIKIFQIKDPVIKYFLLYSWLGSLCQDEKKHDNQSILNNFIENSITYSIIPPCYKKFQKRTDRDDKMVFTYLRNLIGHSVDDALLVEDSIIIEKVTTYTHWLIQIIIEKLEEQNGKQ